MKGKIKIIFSPLPVLGMGRLRRDGKNMEKSAKLNLKINRSYLRQNMPAPEIILWQRLRSKQLGVKFRRQHPIGYYILDFYAPSIKLGIELDGESHFVDNTSVQKDKQRDLDLSEKGIRVLRFLNPEIMKNLDGVLEKILNEIKKIAPSNSLSEYEGGENKREKNVTPF